MSKGPILDAWYLKGLREAVCLGMGGSGRGVVPLDTGWSRMG